MPTRELFAYFQVITQTSVTDFRTVLLQFCGQQAARPFDFCKAVINWEGFSEALYL